MLIKRAATMIMIAFLSIVMLGNVSVHAISNNDKNYHFTDPLMIGFGGDCPATASGDASLKQAANPNCLGKAFFGYAQGAEDATCKKDFAVKNTQSGEYDILRRFSISCSDAATGILYRFSDSFNTTFYSMCGTDYDTSSLAGGAISGFYGNKGKYIKCNKFNNANEFIAELQRQTKNSGATYASSDEAQKAIAGTAATNTSFDISIFVINAILAILVLVVSVISFVLALIFKVVGGIAIYMMSYNPAVTNYQSVIPLWQVVANFGNLIVLAGFIGVGLGYIFDYKPLKQNIEKFIQNIVLIALLVNFSLAGTVQVINVFHNIANVVVLQTTGGIANNVDVTPDNINEKIKNAGNDFINQTGYSFQRRVGCFDLGQIFTPKNNSIDSPSCLGMQDRTFSSLSVGIGSDANGASRYVLALARELALLALFAIAVVVFLKALKISFFRLVYLWVVMVFSPVALVTFFSPIEQFKSFSNWWINKLITMSTLFFIFVFGIYFTQYIAAIQITSSSNINAGSVDLPSLPTYLVDSVFPYILMPLIAIGVLWKLMEYLDKSYEDHAKSVVDAAGRGIQKVAKNPFVRAGALGGAAAASLVAGGLSSIGGGIGGLATGKTWTERFSNAKTGVATPWTTKYAAARQGFAETFGQTKGNIFQKMGAGLTKGASQFATTGNGFESFGSGMNKFLGNVAASATSDIANIEKDYIKRGYNDSQIDTIFSRNGWNRLYRGRSKEELFDKDGNIKVEKASEIEGLKREARNIVYKKSTGRSHDVSSTNARFAAEQMLKKIGNKGIKSLSNEDYALFSASMTKVLDDPQDMDKLFDGDQGQLVKDIFSNKENYRDMGREITDKVENKGYFSLTNDETIKQAAQKYAGEGKDSLDIQKLDRRVFKDKRFIDEYTKNFAGGPEKAMEFLVAKKLIKPNPYEIANDAKIDFGGTKVSIDNVFDTVLSQNPSDPKNIEIKNKWVQQRETDKDKGFGSTDILIKTYQEEIAKNSDKNTAMNIAVKAARDEEVQRKTVEFAGQIGGIDNISDELKNRIQTIYKTALGGDEGTYFDGMPDPNLFKIIANETIENVIDINAKKAKAKESRRVREVANENIKLTIDDLRKQGVTINRDRDTIQKSLNDTDKQMSAVPSLKPDGTLDISATKQKEDLQIKKNKLVELIKNIDDYNNLEDVQDELDDVTKKQREELDKLKSLGFNTKKLK